MNFDHVLTTGNTEIIVRLLIATGLGAIVGLERQLKKRPAGLRTHMLVSLGAAIFTTIGLSLEPNTSRIAEAIVAGIGFLGAGVIIAQGGKVRGVTSAATLWAVAGLGLVVGVGEYILAVIITAIIFGTLLIDRIKTFSEGGTYEEDRD
ncbi:MAG: MgtC/SapB family protein [Thaumarchaeota archaeon]|nr:MgtC/SapB family protein [Nitrososphaerota archaeon]